MKKPLPRRLITIFILVVGTYLVLGLYYRFVLTSVNQTQPLKPVTTPTQTPTPTPSPTPKPLTFAEMNKLYGPCVDLPVLFYHHIQDKDLAATKSQTYLTVETANFRSQLMKLKERGFVSVSPQDLNNFFDSGVSIPKKAVMITFDDAYSDFASNAYPVLKELNFKATVFAPTGLLNNPDYLNWGEVESFDRGLITIGNHTWSHKNLSVSRDVVSSEINTADLQLSERGLNTDKVFAYPYGGSGKYGESVLTEAGYKLAFTTMYGRAQCLQRRLLLPRIRVGNIPNLDI